MATKIMKTCIVCGKEYEYCNKCSSYSNVEAWHNIYHDENCRKIFNMATNYHAGIIGADEAKKELMECDLSNKENFKPSIARLIDELLKEPEVEVVEQIQENDLVPKKRGNRSKAKLVEEALNGDL